MNNQSVNDLSKVLRNACIIVLVGSDASNIPMYSEKVQKKPAGVFYVDISSARWRFVHMITLQWSRVSKERDDRMMFCILSVRCSS